MSLFQFDPSYLLEDVVFIEPNPSNPAEPIVSDIPDWWCASPAGATAMQTWLKDVGMVTTEIMEPPFLNYANGFFTSSEDVALAVKSAPNDPYDWLVQQGKYIVQVPFLNDGKGASENVGYLMQMFKVLPVTTAIRLDMTEFTLDDTASS